MQRTSPHEIRRIGAGEHLFDEPGVLPVGRQRDLRFFEHGGPFHQLATHHHLFLTQVVERRRRANSSRLAASWEDRISHGLAGSHPGYSDAGEAEAQDPANGTVGGHFH